MRGLVVRHVRFTLRRILLVSGQVINPSQKSQAAPGSSWELLVWESYHGNSWKFLEYFTFLALLQVC